MDSLQCLTVFIGVYFAAFGLTCATDHIPENMRDDIKKVKEYFKPSDNGKSKELFGNPIFLKEFDNFESKYEENVQRLLAHEILEVYVTILSTMMNQTKDQNVELSIANIKGRIDTLKENFLKTTDLKRKLQELWAIKTSDSIVQRKALRELMSVFQKASMVATKMVEKKEMRRKRRQVLRPKRQLQ